MDDGSTDATPECLRAWADRLPLRVIRNQVNLGLAPSLNRGLAASTCDVIFRLDADDYWLDDHVRSALAAMRSGDRVVLAAAGVHVLAVDGSTTPRPPPRAHDIRRRLLWDNPLTHSAVCFRRDAVVLAGGYDVSQTFEDYALYVQLLSLGDFAASQALTAVYRVSPNSLSRIDKGRSLVARFRVQRLALRHFFLRHPFAAVAFGLVAAARVLLVGLLGRNR